MLVRQIAMKLSVKRGVKDIATLHRGMRKKKNMLRPAELRTCVISLRGYIYIIIRRRQLLRASKISTSIFVLLPIKVLEDDVINQSLPIIWRCVVSVSVVCRDRDRKLKHLGSYYFLEVVGIGPRNIRKIPENSKYA